MMLIDADASAALEAALVASAVKLIGVSERMRYGRAVSIDASKRATPKIVEAIVRRQAAKLDEARAAVWALRQALAQFEAAHPAVTAAADALAERSTELKRARPA